MEFCLEVELEWLADGLHIEPVAQHCARHLEPSSHGHDLLGGRSEENPGASEVDRCAAKGAGVYLGDTARLGEDELDSVSGCAVVAGFGVQGCAIGSTPGPLVIVEKRLADVADGDFFVVLEPIDCRVLPPAFPLPGSHEERQRLNVRVYVGSHILPFGMRVPRLGH